MDSCNHENSDDCIVIYNGGHCALCDAQERVNELEGEIALKEREVETLEFEVEDLQGQLQDLENQ